MVTGVRCCFFRISNIIIFRLIMNRKNSKISLNCSFTTPATTQDGGHTPNTPEILNTIVNITSQMCQQFSQPQPSNISTTQPLTLPSPSYSDISDSSTVSSLCSPMSPSYSSLTSPQKSHSVVQDFHSQFIKEGLKMKVKQKLKVEPEYLLQDQLPQNIKKETEVITFFVFIFIHIKVGIHMTDNPIGLK